MGWVCAVWKEASEREESEELADRMESSNKELDEDAVSEVKDEKEPLASE